MTERLGDAPIEPAYREQMKVLAKTIDEYLNPDGEKRNGFIIMMFPLNDHGGRTNYISNANRADVVTMLKEQIKRFEGQPDLTGHA
jgi:hypothetical protein